MIIKGIGNIPAGGGIALSKWTDPGEVKPTVATLGTWTSVGSHYRFRVVSYDNGHFHCQIGPQSGGMHRQITMMRSSEGIAILDAEKWIADNPVAPIRYIYD